MSRCIIVGGLPLLPRSAKSKLAQQLESLVVQELSGRLNPISSQTKEEASPPPPLLTVNNLRNLLKIDINTNQHQRLGETVKLLFRKDQISVETVVALSSALQKSCTRQNPIKITLSRKRTKLFDYYNQEHDSNDDSNNKDDSFLTLQFVPTFTLGAGNIRDRAFPSMPFELRRKIQCDGEGAFSLSHEEAAHRTAKLLRCFLLEKKTQNPQQDVVVVDGMAGVGGNALGFSKYWSRVVALEIDPSRAGMLKENIELWKQWKEPLLKSEQLPNIQSFHCCLMEHLASLMKETPHSNRCRLLFLDPPWGGAQYKEKLQQNNGDIVIPPLDYCISHDHTHSVPDFVDCRSPYTFSELVCNIIKSNLFRIVALKLPMQFDEALFVNPLVHGDNDSNLGDDRTHPFRFHFGTSSTKLIVLIQNNGDNVSFANGPEGLDRMIRNVMEWNNSIDLQADDGCREHRPEFYDWEKRRWIMLKYWKGSKASNTSES